jgi:hypothetical protein
MSTVKVTSKKSEDKKPPFVRVRSAGRVSGLLETLAQAYENANSGFSCRWVYSPEHRPELSNVIARKSQGYRNVLISELDSEIASDIAGTDTEIVRIGDAVLMAIPTEVRRELENEVSEASKAQMLSVEKSYYDEVDSAFVRDKGRAHRLKARGKVQIQEEDYEYDIQQKGAE